MPEELRELRELLESAEENGLPFYMVELVGLAVDLFDDWERFKDDLGLELAELH